MDVDETCLSSQIPVIQCGSEHLGSGSILVKTCEDTLTQDSGICDTLKDCTNNTEENSKRFIKESKIHLLSDSEDSFEVFVPKKCSNAVKPVGNAKAFPIGKQKSKKSKIKARTCPYFSTKSVKSYFKAPSKTQEEKDLEIALARSLLDISGGGDNPVITSSNSLEVEKKVLPKGSPLKLKNWTGKKDYKKQGKTILQRRTQEDRDRIITQKVAIVLLEKRESSDECFFKKDIELTSSVLEEYLDKESKLWELSKLSVDFSLTDFYVDSLKSFIEQPSFAFCVEEQNNIAEESPMIIEMKTSKEETSKMYPSESGTSLGISATVDNASNERQYPTSFTEESAASSRGETPDIIDASFLDPTSFNEKSASSQKSELPEITGHGNSQDRSFPDPRTFNEKSASSQKSELPEITGHGSFPDLTSFNKKSASSQKSELTEITGHGNLQDGSFPDPTSFNEKSASSQKSELPDITGHGSSQDGSFLDPTSFNEKSASSQKSELPEITGHSRFPSSSRHDHPETSDYESSQHPTSYKEDLGTSPKSEHPEAMDYEKSQKSNYYLTNFESLKLLSDNWFSLYNNKEYSDIEFLLSDGSIPGHALVLYARCPLLLNDMLKNKVIDLSQFSQRASVVFLKYIYCGKTDAISNLTADEKRDITSLSKKYNLSSLHSLLISETNLSDLYDQSTCEPFSEAPSKCSSNHRDESSKPEEDAKSGNNPNFQSRSSETLSPTHTPEKESLDLTRHFGVFSKTVFDILEESFRSSPLINSSLANSSNKITTEVINLTGSDSPKSPSPKRVHNSTNNCIVINDEYESINLVESPQPVKKIHLLESEVITLDSDSGDAVVKSSPKSEYLQNSINIPDDYDFNHYSPVDFEINELLNSNNSLKDNESHAQDLSKNTEEQFAEGSSLSKCLQSSFPSISLVDEIEFQARQEHYPSHISSTPLSSPAITSSLKNRISTPKQNSSIIVKDATPRPNYSNMSSSELKEELQKYGLKPDLDRKKATTLLNYIYNQIHLDIEPSELLIPSIPCTSHKEPLSAYNNSLPSTSTSLHKSQNDRQVHPEKSGDFLISIPSTSKENPSVYLNSFPTSSSYEKDSSDESSENKNEFAFEEIIFNESKKEESPSEAEPSSLKQIIANFLKSDGALFTSVVTFEPLLLNTFHKTLKDHGVCCSMSDLMDTLDELCVSYRVEKKQGTGDKSRKRKRTKKM